MRQLTKSIKEKKTHEKVTLSDTGSLYKKEPSFGEMFDFNNMYRVKGKKGLVSVVSHTQGCKMAIVCDIYTKGRRAVSVDKMKPLGMEMFFRKDGTFIVLTEVFNNLMAYATASEDYGFEKVSIEDLMPIMVPNFDRDKFKLYKAEEVLGIYIEVTLKYSTLIDQKVEDGEVQLLTEEKE